MRAGAGGGAEAGGAVEFVPARAPEALEWRVPPGVTVLNPEALQEREEQVKAWARRRMRLEADASGGGLPSGPGARAGAAGRVLHSRPLALEWRSAARRGAGLNNLGNTCFLNSVLQCLTYTPPLAQYLLAQEHRGGCAGFCTLCALQQHVCRSYKAPGRPFSPSVFVRSLRQVSRSFRMGRQEDAHEYARCLIDRMHEDGLKRVLPKPSPAEAETDLVSQIFGLRLRSQILCSKCEYASDTFEPAMDLSLEVLRANSLQKALSSFTARETLDGSNKYMCPVCKRKQKAVKQFTVDKAPNVLTVQLKRFDPMLMGGKIDRRIDYPAELDLGPFTSSREPAIYSLFAVLVHAGRSMNSGHYYCYAKSPAGVWLECDDATLNHASERTAMSQRAYMLFYVRTDVPESKQKSAAGLPGTSIPKRPTKHGLNPRSAAQEEAVDPVSPSSASQTDSFTASPVSSPPESPKVRRQIVTRSRANLGLKGVESGGLKKSGSRVAVRWKKMLQFLPMRMQMAERVRRGRSKLRIMQRLKNTPPLQVLPNLEEVGSPARTRARARSRPLPRSPSPPRLRSRMRSRSPSPAPGRSELKARNKKNAEQGDRAPVPSSEGEPAGATRWTEQIKIRKNSKAGKKSPKSKMPVALPSQPGHDTAAAGNDPKGIERFLMGDGRRGQYGVAVPTWGAGTVEAESKARALIESQRPSVKTRDPYEEEYDRGKLKKVRKPKDEGQASEGNAFQSFAGKFGGRGGARRGGGTRRPAGKRTGKPVEKSLRPKAPRPAKSNRSRGGYRGGRRGGRRGSGRK